MDDPRDHDLQDRFEQKLDRLDQRLGDLMSLLIDLRLDLVERLDRLDSKLVIHQRSLENCLRQMELCR